TGGARHRALRTRARRKDALDLLVSVSERALAHRPFVTGAGVHRLEFGGGRRGLGAALRASLLRQDAGASPHRRRSPRLAGLLQGRQPTILPLLDLTAHLYPHRRPRPRNAGGPALAGRRRRLSPRPEPLPGLVPDQRGIGSISRGARVHRPAGVRDRHRPDLVDRQSRASRVPSIGDADRCPRWSVWCIKGARSRTPTKERPDGPAEDPPRRPALL